jgi:hypothetical protein
MSAERLRVRLSLRSAGRNKCGLHTLARVPTCRDPPYEEDNYRLQFTTACSRASGPGSWRWRRLEGAWISTAPDALLTSIQTPLTGADDDTYRGVQLTGGHGTGAAATVVVDGGTITSMTVTRRNVGYVIGDVLQIPPDVLNNPAPLPGAGSNAIDILLGYLDFTRAKQPCP